MLGGPLAAALRQAAGSWTPVFLLAAAMDVLTALLALFELKPMRQAWAAADARSEEVRGAGGVGRRFVSERRSLRRVAGMTAARRPRRRG